ncbi:hypothetical protein A8924_4824 [Saccharopolyspora erythraea NRRL 2338]|nr:hypothetical protein A8924_4824 [Saccharopolyspora erythraea NRRL 2338]
MWSCRPRRGRGCVRRRQAWGDRPCTDPFDRSGQAPSRAFPCPVVPPCPGLGLLGMRDGPRCFRGAASGRFHQVGTRDELGEGATLSTAFLAVQLARQVNPRAGVVVGYVRVVGGSGSGLSGQPATSCRHEPFVFLLGVAESVQCDSPVSGPRVNSSTVPKTYAVAAPADVVASHDIWPFRSWSRTTGSHPHRRTSLGRRANADELAAAVALLVSDNAGFVTGTATRGDSNDRTQARARWRRESRRSQWRCSAAGLKAAVSDMVKPWMVPG